MSPSPNPPALQAPTSSHARRAVLQRFWRMFRTFTASAPGRKAKLIFVALLLLLVMINGLNVLNSYVGRNFMTAIEERRSSGFLRGAWLMIGVFALSTLAAAFARYSEERLGLLWRRWLTQQAVLQYMAGHVYQFIEETAAVPHPDQRISEDIRALTISALSFVLMLINSLFAIMAFSGVLWAISPPLFLVSIAYATLGSLCTVWLGQPLVKLNSIQLDREADFRSELLQVRENAGLIALLRQEDGLRSRLLLRLENLAANLLHVIRVNRRLGFFTNGYNYLIQIIPALLVAPLFISGQTEFGVIAQSALAFTILVNAFSLIVSQFPSLSNFAAVMARLSDLSAAIEKAQSTPLSSLQVIPDPTRIAYGKVTLRAADDDAILIDQLSIVIPRGTRVLIHAASKPALNALLKATAGIGNHSQGILHRPSPDDLHFIPEKPYVAPGTLRQTLLCPPPAVPPDEPAIGQILTTLGLDRAVTSAGGLDSVHDHWDPILSIGEQKLLVVARLLLRAPAFAILDHLDSSLSEEQSKLVFTQLCRSPVTFVHLGPVDGSHCSFHAVLEIHPDGTWEWISRPAGPPTPEPAGGVPEEAAATRILT